MVLSISKTAVEHIRGSATPTPQEELIHRVGAKWTVLTESISRGMERSGASTVEADEEVHASEEESFFVEKIQAGLALGSDSLSSEELRLLLSDVAELSEAGISPEFARRLQGKCVGALSQIYAAETAGGDANTAWAWRTQNETLYKTSSLVLSGIVQNWYLSIGRAQERKASGCLPGAALAVVVVVGISLLLAV
jgi:hypothetical protein